MNLFDSALRSTRLRRNATMALGLVVVASLMALTLARASGAAATAVPLGAAGSFAVLAGAGVTNTGPTTVNGDVGTFPTTTVTGAGSMTINGTNHGGDGVTQQAQTDLVTAYNNAAAQGPTNPIVADLGGQSLSPGVYNSASSIGLTGALTLNAGGDPNAVFVFQAGSALTTASASSVVLVNGAQSCNVFWQIGSSATLGTGSTFRGTVIALQSITVTTGVTVDGRVLARNGAVTLDTDTISRSGCATPAATTAATTTAATTTAATTTTTTATTPTVTTPAPTPAAKRAAAAKAAKVAKAKRIAAAKSRAIIKKTPKPKPVPPVASFGFTG
jgi:cell division septation protein DedD